MVIFLYLISNMTVSTEQVLIMKLLISCILILFLGICTGAADEEHQHSETPGPNKEESNLVHCIEYWLNNSHYATE